MHDYQTMKLMHRHGDDRWVPMAEQGHPNAAEHDPERAWLRGARLFSCTACEDEIAIVAGTAEDAAPQDG